MEEETAAARSGEDNMNKSKELGREDPKNKSGEEGGEGEEGEADKRLEPRMEHPGKQRTRSGTTGWWRPWTGKPGWKRPWRTRVGTREEKEKKEKRTSTWNPDWNIRGRNAPGLEHPGGGGRVLERPG